MAAVTSRYDDGNDVPGLPPVRIARGDLTTITALTALVFGWASRGYGYFFDEAYFVVAGRDHLSWGYFDQPPLVPFIAGMADNLAPGSLFVLRLAATAAVAIGTLMCGLIAAELGGGRLTQSLSAIAYATAMFQILAHWLQTPAIDPALWAVVCWLLVRWTRGYREGLPDDRLLLWAGVVTAVSMQTKFLIPALWLAVLLGAAVLGPRALLRRPKLWIGAAVAVVATVPTLIWQATHGWPYLRMVGIVAAESERGAALLAGMLIGSAVIGLVMLLAGMVALLAAPSLRSYRYLGIAAVLVGAFMFASHGRAYYAMGLYALLIAAGAVGLSRWRPVRPAVRGVVYGLIALVTAASVVMAIVRLPIVSESAAARWFSWAGAMGPTMLAGGDHSTEGLRRVARDTYESMPSDVRDRTALVAQIYPMAAAYDVEAGRAGTSRAFSFHRGYYYFGAPPESMTDMMYIGVDDPDPTLAQGFRGVQRIELLHAPDEDEAHVYRYYGRIAPWQQLWDQWRTF
ncbi:glycosyltransferase family 39 protein [Mycobacterium sp. CBMA271]|uniref:ArnT family glycosyltransferase n=1 Tax=unclassified Mycobacteroides TaxID=2618759 RepID=UPI0012DCD78D|nr:MULTISPECIES: glycosyltransferase family 39 protein [unclassified Mycobacteroides]MUM16675.1 glycosyl transferase family 39 [Mycobacteroides sp. CBMA 326]MUM22015.1 glycosyltransferase family 39 protein [Mycobacteroides sp. CBMA 271]